MGPYGQRPTPAECEQPSKGVASSHKTRAGSARDGKGRREKKRGMGETGGRKKRKQHVAHCGALANTSNNHCNKCNHSSSNCSSTGSSLNVHDSNDSESEHIVVKFEGESLQPCRLPSSLATVFAGAESAVLGHYSFVNRCEDCRCHDGVHRTQHFPFPRRRDRHF